MLLVGPVRKWRLKDFFITGDHTDGNIGHSYSSNSNNNISPQYFKTHAFFLKYDLKNKF